MTNQYIEQLVADLENASRFLGYDSLINRVTKLSLAINNGEVDYEELEALRTILVGELFIHKSTVEKLLNKLVN